jgi:FMN-dependent NADH-azoreductase
MKQILIIESSPRGAESASRQLTEMLRERLRALYPEANFVEHDLAKDPLPHLDYPAVRAIFTRDRAEAESLKEGSACQTNTRRRCCRRTLLSSPHRCVTSDCHLR